jgi:hypothetical protein
VDSFGIAPSVPNTLIIANIQVNSPQVRGTNTPPLADTCYSPDEATQNELDEENGCAHYNAATTSSIDFTWTVSTGVTGVGNWSAGAVVIKSPTTPANNNIVSIAVWG